MPQLYNTLLQSIGRRAERQDNENLINTFVKIAPLFGALSNLENQIIYGRRGTGKTHLLSYLMSTKTTDGDIALKINMNTLGSSGGLYSDNNLPISERASRLLIDFLSQILDELINIAFSDTYQAKFDYIQLCSNLDELAASITEVSVDGQVEISGKTSQGVKNESGIGFGISKELKMEITASDKSESDLTSERSIKRSGVETHHINFGRVNSAFKKIEKSLKCKLWVLLDEWSELPLDIQPYLADLIRHIFFPCTKIVVKIAAIEQRTNFMLQDSNGYVGIEVGADTDMSINLDEYMVFDNNAEKAQSFFKEMLYKHLLTIAKEKGKESFLYGGDFINKIFTQQNAFAELVRSAEGVPRDFIYVISIAAQRADDRLISVEDIRSSAKRWYNQAKERAVSSRKNASILLRWIIEEVIGKRMARAFMLKSDVNDNLINFLFDERVLHIVKDNVSARDQPGVRYKVYSIDYGCYVDLINTTKYPQGFFDSENDTPLTEVPTNDYRSIRRAILDLDLFYKSGVGSAVSKIAYTDI